MKELTKFELLLVNGGSLWTDITRTIAGGIAWLANTMDDMAETLPPGSQIRGH